MMLSIERLQPFETPAEKEITPSDVPAEGVPIKRTECKYVRDDEELLVDTAIVLSALLNVIVFVSEIGA